VRVDVAVVPMPTVAVTGADGFIGARLCSLVEELGAKVVRIVRREQGPGAERRVAGNLETAADLRTMLAGAECVVHLAARAHVLHETVADPAAAFERANVEVTARLARAAAGARVRRFIFVSSIGVNGNATHGTPFTELDEPAPSEHYARSKLRAEQVLGTIAAETGLDVVIVRPPLVYGPGAEGNFRRLLRLAASGVPLPLGAVRNRRNLIGVDNLAQFLALCCRHPAAAGQIFIAAEPEVHSTPDLIAALAAALGRPNRIFACPERLLRACAAMIGRGAEFTKLCGSLEASSAKACNLLHWQPRTSFAEQIRRAAAEYLLEAHRA
jgi:nucleoside-diphosphate-sugar epimerase